MFPVSDDDSQRRTLPGVTFGLIGLNVLFFLVELSGGDQFVENWAFIPARFAENPGANLVTIFTAMF
ncbi:MAG: rhomboid family intramembrane serine protease, partial [Thermoleophilia bacterium]|nr:rhomboid family intramembrane serine protease [Thermoleophilia bacterium]